MNEKQSGKKAASNESTSKPQGFVAARADAWKIGAFDRIMEKLAEFMSLKKVVEFFNDQCTHVDLFESDYEECYGDVIFGLLEDEQVEEVVKKHFAKLIEQKLGAKKVTIEW